MYNLTYRQLQKELKSFRQQGIIPATFKLNQKKVILQEMYEITLCKVHAEDLEEDLNVISAIGEEIQWDIEEAMNLAYYFWPEENKGFYRTTANRVEGFTPDKNYLPSEKVKALTKDWKNNIVWGVNLLTEVNCHKLANELV